VKPLFGAIKVPKSPEMEHYDTFRYNLITEKSETQDTLSGIKPEKELSKFQSKYNENLKNE